MKLKTEFKKFLASFFITNFMILYYTSWQFRDSIGESLKRIVYGFFEDYPSFLLGLAFYISAYLIFNIVYVGIHFTSRLFNIKWNKLNTTTFTIVLLLFLYIVNDQLIFYRTNDYRFISYYTPLTAEKINVDSTNFNKYVWSRKAREITIPTEIREESIIFNEDSTFTLTGRMIVLDKFYLFREIFGIGNEYNITCKYKYENTFISDSLDLYCAVQIRDHKLYLNNVFLIPYTRRFKTTADPGGF